MFKRRIDGIKAQWATMVTAFSIFCVFKDYEQSLIMRRFRVRKMIEEALGKLNTTRHPTQLDNPNLKHAKHSVTKFTPYNHIQ